MWDNELVTVPKKTPPKAAKPKPVKKKAKPKAKPKTSTKLEKDVAALKLLTKAQSTQIDRLNEIISKMQLGDINRFAETS